MLAGLVCLVFLFKQEKWGEKVSEFHTCRVEGGARLCTQLVMINYTLLGGTRPSNVMSLPPGGAPPFLAQTQVAFFSVHLNRRTTTGVSPYA